MTIATGSRHNLAYVAESTFGTTPSTPGFQNLRHTGTTLGLSKDAIESEELRDDRQIAHFRHGNKNVSGDVNIELSYGTFDDFIEAALADKDQKIVDLKQSEKEAKDALEAAKQQKTDATTANQTLIDSVNAELELTGDKKATTVKEALQAQADRIAFLNKAPGATHSGKPGEDPNDVAPDHGVVDFAESIYGPLQN